MNMDFKAYLVHNAASSPDNNGVGIMPLNQSLADEEQTDVLEELYGNDNNPEGERNV